MCHVYIPSCVLKKAVGAAANGVVGQIADAVQKAEADMIGRLASLWVHEDTPSIGTTSGTTTHPLKGGAVDFLWTNLHWYIGFFAVLGLIVAALRLALTRRGEPAKLALQGLLNLVVVSACSVGVVQLATEAGDKYSRWILLKKALHTQVNKGKTPSLGTAMKNLALLSSDEYVPMLVIVLGLLAILSSIVQFMLMIVRFAMLGLLMGVLPVTASISGTQQGQAAFKKAVGWLLAFVLYKPVAATVYAYAIVLMKQNDATKTFAGVVMIVMAVAALPALMRFITPMVSATTGGGGGAGAAALAGGAIATGARVISSHTSSSGEGGGGGQPQNPPREGEEKPTGSTNPGAPSEAAKSQAPGAKSTEGGDGPGGGGPGGGEAPSGSGSGTAPASTTGSGTAAAGSGTAGGGGAAGGASAAGGPAAVAVMATKQVVDKTNQAAQGAAESSSGEGSGPDGSQQ